MSITVEQLQRYVESEGHSPLATIGGKKTFTAKWVKGRPVFTLADGTRQRTSVKELEGALELFNRKPSAKPTKYRLITRKSSYLLRLFENVRSSQQNAPSANAARSQPVSAAATDDGFTGPDGEKRYFTHYWSYRENAQFEGNTLKRIASNQFRQRGVEVDAIVYCVSLIKGQFALVGRMQVGKIVGGEAGARESDQSAGYGDREDHCIAKPNTATAIRFDRVLPLELAMRLRFNGNALKLDPKDNSRLDQQTLRGIRQLDAESAMLLEELFQSEEMQPLPLIVGVGDIDPDGYIVEEGNRVPVYHLKLERDTSIVQKKKREVRDETGRLACECCDFDFAVSYGELGYGYAECHHRVWLSKTPANEFRLTKTSDLAIVCANCHRMLHRDETLDVETLRHRINELRGARINEIKH